MEKDNAIKVMCKTHGITQKKLAAEIGVLPSAVSEAATGKTPITLKFARKLADYFKCPLDVFVDGISCNSEDIARLTRENAEMRRENAEMRRVIADFKNFINEIRINAEIALNSKHNKIIKGIGDGIS